MIPLPKTIDDVLERRPPAAGAPRVVWRATNESPKQVQALLDAVQDLKRREAGWMRLLAVYGRQVQKALDLWFANEPPYRNMDRDQVLEQLLQQAMKKL